MHAQSTMLALCCTAAHRVWDHLDQLKKPYPGLYINFFQPHSGAFDGTKISFGRKQYTSCTAVH